MFPNCRATVVRSHFEANEAADGIGAAAYINSNAQSQFESCSFVANRAQRGSAVCLTEGCSASFFSSFFKDNVATLVGGGDISVQQATLTVEGSIFVGATGPGYGTSLYLERPPYAKILDSTFSPLRDGAGTIFLSGRLGGCAEHPCSAGAQCAYANYSLTCTPCDAVTVSTKGLLCEACPAGLQPNSNRTGCIPCTENTYSTLGVCNPCRGRVTAAGTACSDCPDRQTYAANQLSCACATGFYNASKGVIHCSSAGANWQKLPDAADLCVSCTALSCVTCEQLNAESNDTSSHARFSVTVLPGFSISETSKQQNMSFKETTGQRNVFPCERADSCFGTPIGACADGYAGPLCSNCADGFGRRGLKRTVECNHCGESSLPHWVVVVLSMSFLVAVFALLTWGLGFKLDDGTDDGKLDDGLMMSLISQFKGLAGSPSIKTAIGLTQILQGIPFAFDIDFPLNFNIFVEFFALFNLDMLNLFNVGCVSAWNFYHRLVAQSMTPVLLLVFVFLAYMYTLRYSGVKHTDAQAAQLFNRTLEVMFALIFLVYPSVSQTVFQTFICQDLDLEEAYLLVDFQVECGTSDYHMAIAAGGLLVLAYPIGIPLSLFMLMYKNRTQLGVEGSSIRDDLSPLVGNYKVSCWYWEALEMTRKVILTGKFLTGASCNTTLTRCVVFLSWYMQAC